MANQNFDGGSPKKPSAPAPKITNWSNPSGAPASGARSNAPAPAKPTAPSVTPVTPYYYDNNGNMAGNVAPGLGYIPPRTTAPAAPKTPYY